jgi:hypothetical protein
LRHPPTSLRRFKSRHFSVELELQLLSFFLRKPACHLWKYGPVHQEFVPIPGELFGRARFCENSMQSLTNIVRIGPIGRRGIVSAEWFCLRLGVAEEVLLGGLRHGLTNFRSFRIDSSIRQQNITCLACPTVITDIQWLPRDRGKI